MVRQTSSGQKSRRNARISLSKRKKLIFFVSEKWYSIGKASSRLKIKLSTAKMIVKRYNTHGTFFQPKPHHHNKSTPRIEEGGEDVVKMEEGEVRVKAEEEEISRKQEEERARTDAASAGGTEIPSTLTIPSIPEMPIWSCPLSEFPYFFDGYAFHPYAPALLPFFLP